MALGGPRRPASPNAGPVSGAGVWEPPGGAAGPLASGHRYHVSLPRIAYVQQPPAKAIYPVMTPGFEATRLIVVNTTPLPLFISLSPTVPSGPPGQGEPGGYDDVCRPNSTLSIIIPPTPGVVIAQGPGLYGEVGMEGVVDVFLCSGDYAVGPARQESSHVPTLPALSLTGQCVMPASITFTDIDWSYFVANGVDPFTADTCYVDSVVITAQTPVDAGGTISLPTSANGLPNAYPAQINLPFAFTTGGPQTIVIPCGGLAVGSSAPFGGVSGVSGIEPFSAVAATYLVAVQYRPSNYYGNF